MVLRNNPKISATTRRRVRKIAERLGYKPDARVAELMSYLSSNRRLHREACLGVISFYEDARPWERSMHLKHIYEGMTNRANALGYRLEPIWLRAPGMTYRRICSILDARGIQGLLSFGSPKFDEEFPPEFNHYAVVTQGLSIKTSLHRVINDAYDDTQKILHRVYQIGARRPGLVLGHYENVRGGHSNLSAYLGWCQEMLGTPLVVPVLRLSRAEEKPLLAWLMRHKPDVLILVHIPEMIAALTAILERQGLSHLPQKIGMAVLSQTLQGTDLSGFEENGTLMGEWAMELLVGRIMNHDFGVPVHPKIQMVGGRWVDGKSLPEKIG
jgi:DNA-binding LacI/PurR family transcriptional regulator